MTHVRVASKKAFRDLIEIILARDNTADLPLGTTSSRCWQEMILTLVEESDEIAYIFIIIIIMRDLKSDDTSMANSCLC